MIGFPVCPECKGKGTIHAVATRQRAVFKSACPSCVEGVVITDELVEKAIRVGLDAATEADGGVILGEEAIRAIWRAVPAALAAVLRHLKEKEGTQS